jgi:hypothetical protein
MDMFPPSESVGESPSKPKFNIPVIGLGGSGFERTPVEQKYSGYSGGGITPLAGSSGLMSSTPSNINSNRPLTTMGAGIPDTASVVSQSPMNSGRQSNRFKARMGAAGITPLGSDMSRAKFDFSGYDPEVHRNKRPKSPERKVIKKVEED